MESVNCINSLSEKIMNNCVKNKIYLDLFSKWNDIVGEDIAKIASPHKIIGNDKKVLILASKVGYSIYIQHSLCEILHMINSFFCCEAFSRIKVVQINTCENN